jgi:lipopolysaccharide transport system ATP-binding protein
MKPIIRVKNLSKQHSIGARKVHYPTLRESITGAVRSPLNWFRRNGHSEDSTIWALKDVSFEVMPGEVVGIIGRNGAGKSTLLKILSRITEPTEGWAKIHGRVGSLLEVGTGFHPELTGRENIYLNGAILGMKRAEIERKFDEVVAFAEMEKFIDTPVKHYSSGMYMRLAFAVAAHLEPEILLVDEVLAVGDDAFQKKCLGKISDVAKEGRTVLFVSHNMGAITRLCERSVWLNEGKIALDGLSSEVIGRYQSQYLTACAEWKRPQPVKADGAFAFLSVVVKDDKGSLKHLFEAYEPVSVEICYLVRRSLSGCQIGVRICNSDGLVVFTTADADNFGVSACPKRPGRYQARFTIPSNLLSPGTYYLLIAGHLPYRTTYEVIEQAVVFEVASSSSLVSLDGRLGVITPLIHWETYQEPLS